MLTDLLILLAVVAISALGAVIGIGIHKWIIRGDRDY